MQDVATSATELTSHAQTGAGQGQGQEGQQDSGEAPKEGKVQINALARMISALRR